MLSPGQIREIVDQIKSMDREQIIVKLRSFQAPFPIDFTDSYLQTIPLEKLQHVFAGLCIHCQQMPYPRESDRRRVVRDALNRC
jgi:hypothetical protein